MLDTEAGELQERRLKRREEAEQFYRSLATARPHSQTSNDLKRRYWNRAWT